MPAERGLKQVGQVQNSRLTMVLIQERDFFLNGVPRKPEVR